MKLYEMNAEIANFICLFLNLLKWFYKQCNRIKKMRNLVVLWMPDYQTLSQLPFMRFDSGTGSRQLSGFQVWVYSTPLKKHTPLSWSWGSGLVLGFTFGMILFKSSCFPCAVWVPDHPLCMCWLSLRNTASEYSPLILMQMLEYKGPIQGSFVLLRVWIVPLTQSTAMVSVGVAWLAEQCVCCKAVHKWCYAFQQLFAVSLAQSLSIELCDL